jgi:hypothetical protein
VPTTVIPAAGKEPIAMTCPRSQHFEVARPRVTNAVRSTCVTALGLLAFGAASATEAPPPELAKLRSAFAAAVAAKDVKALAALSRFPLTNQVYQAPDKISRAGFVQSVIVNDYWEEAECLRKAPLERDVRDDRAKASWFVACDHGNNIFHFVRDGSRWAYGGFESVAE